MAQRLRAHAVLTEDQSSVPSTHIKQLTDAWTPASESPRLSHLLGSRHGHTNIKNKLTPTCKCLSGEAVHSQSPGPPASLACLQMKLPGLQIPPSPVNVLCPDGCQGCVPLSGTGIEVSWVYTTLHNTITSHLTACCSSPVHSCQALRDWLIIATRRYWAFQRRED